MTSFVGLDIGSKSVDMCVRHDGRNGPVERFSQTPESHQQLVEKLKKLAPEVITMEATGIYYLDLAVALHEAGLPVAVINPKSFRRFAELTLTDTKTDPIDAALLAEYGQRMTPPLWTPPEASSLALRDIARQINRLVVDRTRARNRLHALQSKQQTPKLLIDDQRQAVTELERRIERLEQAAMSLIEHSPTLAAALAALQAAKGIGTASAIAILGELCVLPETMKANQVSRYAGLNVRVNQSGTSVNTPGQLSKAGNTYLRSALYMPSMVAIRHDPRAKAFYQALVARGKKKKQALCAVMRKYLTGLWACLQHNTDFDSTLLFSEQHLQG